MASTKYQIFISSTFSDLQEERQLALKAVLDLDHIPSGMEAFPAIDMEQFEYVKKIIDECDYYLLIIGARYGSTDSDGVSFTEREFDYAVSKGTTVIALLHNDIQNLPRKNFDTDSALENPLNTFREKVKSGRMVRFWSNRDQLIAAMMQSIVRAISAYPAIGWIRGDEAAADEIVRQNLQLSNSYAELLDKYNKLVFEIAPKLTGLATLNELYAIKYTYMLEFTEFEGVISLSWANILKIVGPALYAQSRAGTISSNIRQYIESYNRSYSFLTVNNINVDTIKLHLHALGMLRIETSPSKNGSNMELISLTEKGKTELLNIIAVKSDTQSSQ